MGKVTFFFFLFAMVKAIVPRYRYDQLMRLGWKIVPADLAGRGGDRGGVCDLYQRSDAAGLRTAGYEPERRA
jgi:hypothetical protein